MAKTIKWVGDDLQLSDNTVGDVTLNELSTGDSIPDATSGNKGLATATQITKLDGIEALADVTDATNVNAAGATMNEDTDVSGNDWVKDEDDMSSDDATKVPTQQSVKAYVDALKPNDIMIMANGFIIAGSGCELVETDGTDAKLYDKHLAVAKTEWFDVPKIRIPDTYDGGDIDITVCFRSAGASKKHSLGIRVASVGAGDAYNPDLASAYQLYNEEASDATIGDIKYKTVTVTQSNHKMVAGENWYCKFVMEDDAGADADDVLIEAVRIEWNKG